MCLQCAPTFGHLTKDVIFLQWSYGVTMWEIFSGGKAPYPGTDPATLLRRLEQGERMPKPNNAACTEEM